MMQIYFSGLLFISCLMSTGLATASENGIVRMQGHIVDTACSIKLGDADQSISLGTIPLEELINNGRGPSVPFSIHLVNCVLNSSAALDGTYWKDMRITFKGEPNGFHSFALEGDTQGESLVIADNKGHEVEPGKPMPAMTVEPGNMTLHYRMWLIENHHGIRPGKFHTTVRYFMEYD
ncbi:TPA: fimbrial protein [Salmonella enterica]